MVKRTQSIRYDNAAIIQQAMIYTDPYRVLAEYVDNSIDAAETQYCDGVYKPEVCIEVKKHSKGSITISDNACGIAVKPDEPYTIFRSLKRDDPSTNGKFGFGLFSFLSICNKLEIETWHRGSKMHHRFAFTPDVFMSSADSEPVVEIYSKEFTEDYLGGTLISLSEFHEGQFADISINNLKTEVEKHFELILQRPNITVKLIDEMNNKHICRDFDYKKYCSKPYTREIKSLHKTHSKKQRSLKEIDISNTPAKIFLISSPDKEFDRPIFFVVKGRRVADVSSVEQFRTNRKFQIWSKSNVTGYIDVTGVLSPVISRKDFVRDERSKAFFQTLLDCEDEILRYIESHSQVESSDRLKELESKINEALKEFTQQEGNHGNNSGNVSGKRVFIIKGVAARNTSGVESQGTRNSSDSSPAQSTSRTKVRNKDHRIEILSNTNGSDSGPAQLEVRIDTVNMPHTDLNGLKLRSVMSGNTVHIFRKHEDFQMRVKSSPKGHEEVNQRLVNYIAMEVSMHYLNRKTNQIADESNENKIRNFITTVLRLEEKLKSLDGMKI